MATTNPLVPTAEWRMLTVTIPPDTTTFKYVALAPGCTNTPHAGDCGCMTFDKPGDADTYIRGKIRG
jgi:hypothetical protein